MTPRTTVNITASTMMPTRISGGCLTCMNASLFGCMSGMIRFSRLEINMIQILHILAQPPPRRSDVGAVPSARRARLACVHRRRKIPPTLRRRGPISAVENCGAGCSASIGGRFAIATSRFGPGRRSRPDSVSFRGLAAPSSDATDCDHGGNRPDRRKLSRHCR